MPHVLHSIPLKNQALLVVCARKAIRTAGIAGIVWAIINLLVGYKAVQMIF